MSHWVVTLRTDLPLAPVGFLHSARHQLNNSDQMNVKPTREFTRWNEEIERLISKVYDSSGPLYIRPTTIALSKFSSTPSRAKHEFQPPPSLDHPIMREFYNKELPKLQKQTFDIQALINVMLVNDHSKQENELLWIGLNRKVKMEILWKSLERTCFRKAIMKSRRKEAPEVRVKLLIQDGKKGFLSLVEKVCLGRGGDRPMLVHNERFEELHALSNYSWVFSPFHHLAFTVNWSSNSSSVKLDFIRYERTLFISTFVYDVLCSMRGEEPKYVHHKSTSPQPQEPSTSTDDEQIPEIGGEYQPRLKLEEETGKICASCGKLEANGVDGNTFLPCQICRVSGGKLIYYCSRFVNQTFLFLCHFDWSWRKLCIRQCQIDAWKLGHKHECGPLGIGIHV